MTINLSYLFSLILEDFIFYYNKIISFFKYYVLLIKKNLSESFILGFKFKFFSDNIIKEKSRNDFNNKEHTRK